MCGGDSSQGRFVDEVEAVRDGDSVVIVSGGGPLGSGHLSPGESRAGWEGKLGRGSDRKHVWGCRTCFHEDFCTHVAQWDTEPGRGYSLYFFASTQILF